MERRKIHSAARGVVRRPRPIASDVRRPRPRTEGESQQDGARAPGLASLRAHSPRFVLLPPAAMIVLVAYPSYVPEQSPSHASVDGHRVATAGARKDASAASATIFIFDSRCNDCEITRFGTEFGTVVLRCAEDFH